MSRERLGVELEYLRGRAEELYGTVADDKGVRDFVKQRLAGALDALADAVQFVKWEGKIERSEQVREPMAWALDP